MWSKVLFLYIEKMLFECSSTIIGESSLYESPEMQSQIAAQALL